MTRDWARDMRVLTDVLLSQAGYVGTHSRTRLAHLDDDDHAPDRQPRLYVSGAELTGRFGRIDPKKSGQMWSAYRFEPQTRPHHVSGTLTDAVEYALRKEHRYCLERGVKPLFSGALRSVQE
ncbi:uncharacterized protein B0H64DRAFT_377582 [Chaetomium fimeti]|uniref:Uncharacterized protein n=1 Tax=Chaetomium fimeti TaxID=1854472 RepID=A0AAE0LP24_9PEZI|nr:hypothetical protein B0H64DRAFT_377582 [Chaetomium fimeti]